MLREVEALNSIPKLKGGGYLFYVSPEMVAQIFLIIPALGRWRQKDQEFKIILDYIGRLKPNLGYMRSYLKTKNVSSF